jgi:pimeloyl-ACP methyl ester carboxylesterase
VPDASLVRIAGAGHLSNLERPAAFDASVEDFLGRFTRG